MKSKITTTLLSCAALAAFTPSLHAAITLLDNTSAGTNGNKSLGLGLAFSTGSQGTTLGSISLIPIGGFTASTGSLTVSLYAGDSSTHRPTGSALASETFSDVSYDSMFSYNPPTVTEAFLTNFSLAANSNYVLELTSDNGDAMVASTGTPMTAGGSGLTYLGSGFIYAGTFYGPYPGASAVNGQQDPYIKLTGNSVPEPSALALLGLGAVGLATRRRRVG